MEPTVLRDERVLVDEAAYRVSMPARGDIVVYRSPLSSETLLLKRIVGMPGETVEIKHKSLFINGVKLHEQYAVHTDSADYTGTNKLEPYRSRDSFGPLKLGLMEYFVLGDNRDTSMDSRYHGAVPRTSLIGKVSKAIGKAGVREPR